MKVEGWLIKASVIDPTSNEVTGYDVSRLNASDAGDLRWCIDEYHLEWLDPRLEELTAKLVNYGHYHVTLSKGGETQPVTDFDWSIKW